MPSCAGQFVRDLLTIKKDTHAWIRAGGLGCPTLVVSGLEDPSTVWDPIGLTCLNLILPNVDDAQMHIFNHSGHYLFREHPEGFLGVVKAFIASSRKDWHLKGWNLSHSSCCLGAFGRSVVPSPAWY